jgi:hypothetical protein
MPESLDVQIKRSMLNWASTVSLNVATALPERVALARNLFLDPSISERIRWAMAGMFPADFPTGFGDADINPQVVNGDCQAVLEAWVKLKVLGT